MADQSQSGGLLGMDPDLVNNIALGLLSVGGKNLAGQGNLGQAMQGALGNYYAQKQAKVGLLKDQIANQMAAQKMGLIQQAAQQQQDYYGNGQDAAQPGTAPQMGQAPALPQGMAPAASGASPPAGTAPASVTSQAPSPWLNPPTPNQLSRNRVMGMTPGVYAALGLANGKDLAQINGEIRTQQQKDAQEQAAPLLSKLQTIAKLDSPVHAINADNSLKAAWNLFAPQLGYDPVSDLNEPNARNALIYAHNQVAAAIGAPLMESTPRMIQGVAPDGRITQTNQMTGEVKYESAGPNIISAEDKIKNNLEAKRFAFEMQQKAAELKRVGMPAGYEADPNNPGSVRPIAGGPADPLGPGGGMGNRAEVTFNRITSAGNSAAESLKNISELPMGASTGWFGIGAHSGSGILSAAKANLANKLNPQEVQDYNVMISGLGRNLATLETQGLAPGAGFVNSMDALHVQPGDSQMTVLRKQAEARQIIETNLQASLTNPKVPQPQKQFLRDVLSKTQAAIPYTNHDVTAFEQSTNPRATIMDFANSKGLGQHPTDIQAILTKYPPKPAQ